MKTAPDPDAILAEIKLAIEDSVPYPSRILEAVYNAVADNTWTVLPPKSYVDRGVFDYPVIAFRNAGSSRIQVVYSNGDIGDLLEDWTLVVGK